MKPSENPPTRQSLITRLKDSDDQESWSEFFNTYWNLIYSVAVKAGLKDAEAQDVVQEAVISVAKQMPSFHYDPAIGSFKSWLLLITQRRIADHLRKHYRQMPLAEPRPRQDERTSTAERVADPAASLCLEAVWDAEWEKHVMDVALQRVKGKVSGKQFQIFDFYVLKKWPVTRVAKSLGVSLSQVYVAKHRVSAALKKEIRELEKQLN